MEKSGSGLYSSSGGKGCQFIISGEQVTSVISRVFVLGTFGTGAGYSGWSRFAFTFIIPAAVFGRSAASSASAFHSSGHFGRVHKLPMSGFLSCAEGAVIFAIVSLGSYMGTGINFFLQRLASVMVTIIATAVSTTTAPRDQKDKMPLRVVPGLSWADVVRLKIV